MNDNKNRSQAIALCRVSTVKQSEENSSMEAQDKRVREAAELLNTRLVRIWESKGVSSRSGKNLARKDLNEMLAYAKANKKVQFVIVDEADRFMRGGLKEHYYWTGRFEFEAGAKLIYAKKTHLFDQADTPLADFEEVMDVMRAKMTNDERINKTTINMQARVSLGYYPSNPKSGYKTTETTGLHEPKEPEWSLLRSGFLQVLDGALIRDAVASINAAGYKRKSGRSLDTSHFKEMLIDPYYAGIVQMSNWPVNPNGLHKAMITPEQHEELKALVKGVVPRTRKQFNSDFRLSKIMGCTECLEENKEHPLLVGYDQNNGKPGDKRKFYKRYRCRACGANILQPALHEQLSSTLLSLKLAEDKVQDFLAALRQVWEQEQSLSFAQVEALTRRLESLTHDKKEVVLKQVRGTLAEERADIAINALDEEIRAAKEQIESITTVERDFVEFVEFAIDTVENLRERFWELDAEHVSWCKQLLFPEGFSVSRDKKVYTPRISEFYRLNRNAPKDVSADFAGMVIPAGVEPAIFRMRT